MVEAEERVKDLLAAAAELPADEVGPFLDRHCPRPSSERTEIESLLKSHLDAGRFLNPVQAKPLFTVAGPSNASSASADWVSEYGRVIDRYHLSAILGEGGFGVVYRAEQLRPIRRTVALKVIKAGMETGTVMGRFELERQALGSMGHPNIARLLDAGTTEQGRPYFVMELVDGLPITAHADQFRLSVRARIALFIPVCRAVHHAHRKAVLHRDLKPSNILVDSASGSFEAKVIDFGVAKAIADAGSDSAGFTQHRQLVGTPRYMSPEQSSSDAAGVDTRSDIYSLGAVLHELLTGATPSTSIAPGNGALNSPASPATGDSPDPLAGLPRELAWIIRRATDPDRSQRYDSAAALGDDLESYLQGRPVKAGPPGVAYLARKFAARHKAAVGVLLAVILLLAGGVVQSIMLSRMRTSQALTAAAQQARRLAEQSAAARLRDSYVLQAHDGPRSGLRGQRFASVSAVARATEIRPGPDLRNELITALAVVDVEHVRNWESLPGTKITAVSPNRDRSVEWREVMHWRVARANDRTTLLDLPDAPRDGVHHLFDESGNHLACRYFNPAVGLVVCDMRSNKQLFRVPIAFNAMDFARDGKTIVIGTADGHLDRYELATGNRIASLNVGGDIEAISCRPGSDDVAEFDESGGLRIVRFGNNGSPIVLPRSMDQITAIAWSPNGRQLAVGGSVPSEVDLIDCEARTVQATLPGHSGGIFDVCFADQGRLIVSAAWDGAVRVWDVCSKRGVLVCYGAGYGLQPFTDQSIFLSSSVSAIEQLRLVPSPIVQSFSCLADEYGTEAAAFSPDARLLVASTASGLRSWSISTGQPMGYLSIPSARTPVFIADGRRLLLSTQDGVMTLDAADLGRNDPPAREFTHGRTSGLAVSADEATAVFTEPVPGNTKPVMLSAQARDPRVTTTLGQTSTAPRYIAISPDGHWALTAERMATGVDVWNVSERRLQSRLPRSLGATETGGVAFAPDGRSAVTSDIAAYSCWSVPDWQPLWKLPRKGSISHGMVAFSRDGRILAVAGPEYKVLLLDPASGQELARLDSPTSDIPVQFAFSPDDSKLAVCRIGGVMVWDISLIRHQLASFGLDWQ